MKHTFSQFCCGLLCIVSTFALAETLRADDASQTEGVVRTINYADSPDDAGVATTGQPVKDTGTAFTGEVMSGPPIYSESNVEQVFQPTPRFHPRRRRLRRHPQGPLWDAYTAWGVRPGNRRVLGDGQVVVPLWQSHTSMLFADVRGQVDDAGAYEGNWGVGFRQIRNDSWILGAYGFYDRRKSDTGNYFSQATFGIEALSVEWEARANVYLPDSRSLAIAGSEGPTRALLFNNRAIIRHGANSLEQALYGVDIEIGKLFYEWGADVELRGFLTAYHFDTENQGFTNISGGRGRLELRLYDLNALGEGSRLNLGAEMQYDGIRSTQSTAMLRIQIPLGRRRPVQTRIQRRMMDRIVRDIDIVSVNRAQPGFDEEAIDVKTGRSFGRIDIVDASSPNVPLAVGQNSASVPVGTPSTVVMSSRAGQINLASTINLTQFQNLIGTGYTAPVVGAVTGTRRNLTFGNARRPVISAPGITAIRVENDTSVRGVEINGATDGIFGTTVTGVCIDRNVISNATDDGINILTSFTGVISNNISNNNNGQYGIEIGIAEAGSIISGNTTNSNGVDGINILILDGILTGNTSNSNGFLGGAGQHGYHVSIWGAGSVISNNTARFNGQQGFFIFGLGGIQFGNSSIANGAPSTAPFP